MQRYRDETHDDGYTIKSLHVANSGRGRWRRRLSFGTNGGFAQRMSVQFFFNKSVLMHNLIGPPQFTDYWDEEDASLS